MLLSLLRVTLTSSVPSVPAKPSFCTPAHLSEAHTLDRSEVLDNNWQACACVSPRLLSVPSHCACKQATSAISLTVKVARAGRCWGWPLHELSRFRTSPLKTAYGHSIQCSVSVLEYV